MPRSVITRFLLAVLLALGLARSGSAQNIPFTSGPIPLCDTSTFTADLVGYGYLSQWQPWSFWIQTLTINITSDHPQTLQISLTSPEGTTLLLSAFNGAGGQNYTNTVFTNGWGLPITSGTAPFTGNWTPQGGAFGVFEGEYADGTWTITVVDTACVNGGTGPGGTWTPGWFDGSSGNGGFAFTFTEPPPCWGGIPSDVAYICPGGTFDLTNYYGVAWSGYSYTFTESWTGSTVPDPTAVGVPGTYNVEAVDPWNGCWYWATFDVIVSPQIALGPDQVMDQCSGAGPMDLTALFSLAGVIPAWSLDGSPITNATAAAATDPGVYELIGQNWGSCNDTALVTLTITADPILGPDQAVSVCPGSSMDLTALYATGADAMAWTESGVPVADPASVTSPGIYTLTVSNAAGCTATADVTLTVQALSALGADQSLDLCSNASLDLTTLYTTAGLAAAWTLTGLPVADPSSVSAAGTYRLVTSNGSGCTDTAFVSVNAVTSPSLGVDATAVACAGNTVDLTSYFNTTGLSTAWTVSGSAVPDPSAVGATGLYTLIATGATGCSDTAQVDLTVAPDLLLGPDQVLTECEGTAVDLTALYTTGPNATAWTESGVLVPDPTDVTNAGVYTLTATNAAGCSATAMVTLDLAPTPALGTDQALAICVGSEVDLTALYGNTGLAEAWTLNGAPVADPSAVAVTGAYQVVVINGSGCGDTAVVALAVSPNPSLGADQSFSLCPWQTVDLSTVFPVDDLTASYTLNGQPVNDPTAVSEAGTYVVTVTDATGCTDEAAASVIAMDCLCVAEFVHEGTCLQDPVQFMLLADSAIVSAHWDFGGATSDSWEIDPNVTFSKEDVVVRLQATLSCGVVEVQRTIRVRDCADSCSVWIPTAFTPDSDDINDTWTWRGECEPEDFSMEIYDRFGEVVFASQDPMSSWDGTYHGKTSPTGVYVYRVGYRLPYQDRKEVMGSMALVR